MMHPHTSFISTPSTGKSNTELSHVEFFSASRSQSKHAWVQLPMIQTRNPYTVSKLENSNKDPPFGRQAVRYILPLCVNAMVVSESPLINGKSYRRQKVP